MIEQLNRMDIRYHAFERRMSMKVRLLVLTLFALLPLLAHAADADLEATRVAPFAVTPWGVVDAMLKMANVGPNDFVVDLGSGDGRLVIAAVEHFGARGGFGVDISKVAVDYANGKAAEAGVADRVQFLQRDLFVTDVSKATVVTVYLFPTAMPRLRDKLFAELAPGTRVVSHDFPFPGWHIDRVAHIPAPEKNDTTGRGDAVLYLYTVPARNGRS
jgi:SAM-dependent methyltransferase